MSGLQAQLKRKNIIAQLNKLGVYEIEEKDLKVVPYSKLLKALAAKRSKAE